MVNMVKEQIGKAVVYIPDQASIPEPDPDTVLIQEIVQNYPPQEYHAGITGNKNYNAMYQLAETRGSLIGWLDLPSGTRTAAGSGVRSDSAGRCADRNPGTGMAAAAGRAFNAAGQSADCPG